MPRRPAPAPESAAAERPKLHKVLAQAGLGSRLEMEKLIAEGGVSVNGQVAHVGQRVQPADRIAIHGQPLRLHAAAAPVRVIAYHKPTGEVVTHNDPQQRPTVFAKLPRLRQGKWLSVGRLDINTEGLLLLTNSGELANRLMHPRFGLEREYAARVLGALDAAEQQRLLNGVELDDGPARFESLTAERGGGEGVNQWYRVTIAEGRNREVRRLFEATGRAVSRLIRIRYGQITLPRGLRRGRWVELGPRDLADLLAAADMPAPQTGAAPQARPRRQSDRGGSAGPRPSRPQAPEERQDRFERFERSARPGPRGRRDGRNDGRTQGYISPQPRPMDSRKGAAARRGKPGRRR